jgi:hypothetical protein
MIGTRSEDVASKLERQPIIKAREISAGAMGMIHFRQIRRSIGAGMVSRAAGAFMPRFNQIRSRFGGPEQPVGAIRAC